MSQSRVVDASGTPVPNSPTQLTSSNFGSPDGPGSDLDGMGTRSGSTTDEKLDALLSKCVHFETQIAQIPSLDVRNRISMPSLHVCANSKQVPPLAPAAPTGQDLGIYSDIVTAPQPLGLSGPMAQSHLMTIEIRDVDLIFFQALRMNMHEVPSYCGSRVNNTTLGLRIGSIAFGKSPTCPPFIQACQNSLQNSFPISQTCIRNKSPMSGLCAYRS